MDVFGVKVEFVYDLVITERSDCGDGEEEKPLVLPVLVTRGGASYLSAVSVELSRDA